MYEAKPLSYGYNDLEPDIDRKVMYYHYDKHYLNYLRKLNEALKNSSGVKHQLEDIPKNIEDYPLKDRGDILYNAGGVLNHNLYFLSMNPKRSNPKGNLLNKINIQYGNFENFRKDFMERASNLVGSGYTFLVSNDRGDLTIVNMINQETPLSYNLIPLFTIDLWEHAYYLQYKNDRNMYMNNFWNIANFDYASKKYEEIVNKR